MTKWVYLFSEVAEVEDRVPDWDAVRGLLGGKGAGLADMTRLGIPVPPGFTVTTEGCNAFQQADETLPDSLWEQELEALRALQASTGKSFGDHANPLLVSCRSGAKFSMPGMMDTILNLGLNDDVAEGLVARTKDPRFVYDAYRRLVQMFGSVVLGVPDEVFEAVITARRRRAEVESDTDLTADDWREITRKFKEIVRTYAGTDFPDDPVEQLRLATEAVFRSWGGKRAVAYRNAAGIPHDLGTAVNIQAMVFGNMGDDCATGVAMSRNASTGEPHPEGDYLINAQGEDVVAGIRKTLSLDHMRQAMPELYGEFVDIARRLEKHHGNMQDIEFTIEHSKLWLLQTRDGKRTAQAEVRIAVDMVEEGLIDRKTAVRRVQPEQIEFFLHPQLDPEARKAATPIATGLNVSPGAAVGIVALDADRAVQWANETNRPVVLVRPETKPDDVHGMLAAEGILTSRGGRTSHAALVARQFGKPAVVGVAELDIDLTTREIRVGEKVIREGEFLSLDGTLGEVFEGQMPTVRPDISNAYLSKVLDWADDYRRLGIWANADYPGDAELARSYGAEGLGLARTEHMFFEPDRLPIVQAMIMAGNVTDRAEAIEKLEPLQRADFEGLFRAMDGAPVVIRLLDPPLHEFLPAYDELLRDLADLKMRIQHYSTMSEVDSALNDIRHKEDYLDRLGSLREANPMLGTRGVRLGVLIPELTAMQARAIFEAAVSCIRDGVEVRPKIMIPLTVHANELRAQQKTIVEVAKAVQEETKTEVPYQFGTMVEAPRAALVAGELAEVAEFFSFGTNDLTQTTFGISRDDAERGFLVEYLRRGILPENPFTSIDEDGVGALIRTAVSAGRQARPDIEIGVCGEHGGDPKSIAFCHTAGLNYVSCSPYRVPVARLAAAHAALADEAAEEATEPAKAEAVVA